MIHLGFELLAPVGSFKSLEAAVQNGADAVYLGGKLFSARQYASNFDEDELKRAVEYCHIRGVKVFVTVNTLVSNDELLQLGKYLLFLYNIDVDAIIVQDLGVAKFVKEMLPDFELHASTQMSVHNLEGVKLLENMGFSRVVLSREMTKEEIEYVQRNTNVEIEVFVHGALCVGYSGQCLMSSMIGGRSGNRGRCAQPCRKTYDLVDMDSGKNIKSDLGEYLLSPRDLNTLKNVDKVLATGIKSLKIEGRMKRPEYVATVVKAYRDAIDQYKIYRSVDIDDQTLKKVKQMFNRRFTKGYILGQSGKDIMSFSKPSNRGIKVGDVIGYDKNRKRVKIKLEDTLSKGDGIEIWTKKGDNVGTIVEAVFKKGEKLESAEYGDVVEIKFKHVVSKNSPVYKTSDIKLLKESQKTYERKDLEILLYGEFKGTLDSEAELLLWDDQGNYIKEKGETPIQKALKTPITKERIKEQISKLGNTPYRLKELKIHIDENIVVPASELNRLRRNGVEKLNEVRQNHNKREFIAEKDFHEKVKGGFKNTKRNNEKKVSLRVKVDNINQLKAVLDFSVDQVYYSDLNNIEEALKMAREKNVLLIPHLPQITEDEELIRIKKKLDPLEISSVMVSNLGELNIIKDKNISTDFSLNVFNNGSIHALKDLGVDEVTLSLELTLKQMKEIVKNADMDCEAIIHGNMIVMVSKYCPINAVYKENHSCSVCKNKQFGLKDPLGMVFPIQTKNCNMYILNSKKLCLIESMREIIGASITNLRIQFTTEGALEVKDTLKAYTEAIRNSLEGREQSKVVKEYIRKMKEKGITKGHFFRGVM